MALLAAWSFAACADGNDRPAVATGTAVAELTVVPGDVRCIQITLRGATGGTRRRNFDVAPGQGSVLNLGPLAPGSLTLSGAAFDLPCAKAVAGQQPTWISDSLTVLVRAGLTTNIPLVLRPNLSTHVSVDFQPVVEQIDASSSTYAVLSDGTIQSWGANGAGQLGNGTFTFTNTPGPVADLDDVVKVDGGTDGRFACALTGAGQVWCWGDNDRGELGDGTDQLRLTPVRVVGVDSAVDIAAGQEHACAALRDGTAVCWGANESGQLGNGETSFRSLVPVAVISGIANTPMVEITAGNRHTCIRTGMGLVYCWGANDRGQLCSSSPLPPGTPTFTDFEDAVAVAASGSYTCSIRSDGRLFCCGANDHGQLGIDSPDDAPLPVEVQGLSDVVDVGPGPTTNCAVVAGGAAFCWGQNTWANVGDGTKTERLVPVPVVRLPNATAIVAGQTHSCALVDDATMRCWGDNANGQIGDGTNVLRYFPTPPLL